MNRVCRALICLLLPTSLAAQEVSRAAREMFNVGVQLFNAEQYRAASETFEKAVSMAPGLFQARVYLATSYAQQYLPGVQSEENKAIAAKALDSLQEVLKRDPKNLPATDSTASLYLQMRDLPNATEWVHRLLLLNPGNKGGLTTLGLIIWLEFAERDREARLTLEMKPGEPGPLPDEELRAELKAMYWGKLQDGIASVNQVLADDPTFGAGMAAMVRLLRSAADLADDDKQYKSLMAQADDWAKKAVRKP